MANRAVLSMPAKPVPFVTSFPVGNMPRTKPEPGIIGGRRISRLSRREHLQLELQAAEAHHRKSIPAAGSLEQWGLSLRTPFGKATTPGLRARTAVTRSVSTGSLPSPTRLAPLEFNRSALPAHIVELAGTSKPKPLPPARPKEVMKLEPPLTGSFYPAPLGRYAASSRRRQLPPGPARQCAAVGVLCRYVFTTRGSKCYTREN